MSQRAMTVHKGDAVATTSEPDVSIGMTFDGMVAMGDKLVRTGFLPQAIKNGAQAAAIILAGRELGMPMMRALRSVKLVLGNVSESADSQLARFKSDGGHAKFLELTPQKAVLWLRHPNGDEHTETWDESDRKAAGLAGGMHAKYAKAMNRSRAITAGLKSIGWEGSAGAYDPDEAAEFAPPTVVHMPSAVQPDPIVDPEPEAAPQQSVRSVLDTIEALRMETLDAFATWIKGSIATYSEAEQKQIRGAYSAKSKALKAEAAAEKQRLEEAAQRAQDAADAADAEGEVVHAGND